VYFVTARTLYQIQHFKSAARLTWVRDRLLQHAATYQWRMEAWAVLSNHYHFIAHSPSGEGAAESLGKLLKHLHADVTRHINKLDGVEGRKIWHNYRETHLTFQKSYLARLHYTHHNPVHHGLVALAADYEWCSAREFEHACTPAWVKTIAAFQYDEIAKGDEDLDCGDLSAPWR